MNFELQIRGEIQAIRRQDKDKVKAYHEPYQQGGEDWLRRYINNYINRVKSQQS